MFYSLKHAATNVRRLNFKKGGLLFETLLSLHSFFCLERDASDGRGIKRVELDRVDDFMHLRKEFFGCELAPLPQNLQLPEVDLAVNRLANLTKRKNPAQAVPVR